MAKTIDLHLDFAFFNILKTYYDDNRGKIRRNYTDLTRKFLNYNDKDVNPSAYLWKPQFEALEMYIFIKEFLNNEQVSSIFDDWVNRKNKFSDMSFYASPAAKQGQIEIMDLKANDNAALFKRMKKVSEVYPNYIYALSMGLGKTILMATCIFYEFLVANKNPKDKRFCHNALVFAPDKTVLESLREIVSFDKTLVVPPEYARVLDANIKIHFLEDSGTTLNTLDNSDFNIIISNTQKIIVKKKQKRDTSVNKLFKMGNNKITSPIASALASIYGDDEIEPDDLIFNQRFKKLCRLSQIGVYVDEAHHIFGSELENDIRDKNKDTCLRSTINLLASELVRNGTSVVACYNYTGTPYVKNEILPEVVYAYGLREAISYGFLKNVGVTWYENVKSKEFLKAAIVNFWNEYGGKTYEGLLPKLAIFGSQIAEVEDEIRPEVEKILIELGIPLSKILVNVGDQTITKNEDIHEFVNLDKRGSEVSQKQFILLVNKGREGWNCRSLFGVAMYRSPKSKIFVLQATMRCLRKITGEQQKAQVYLSKDNYDILNNELKENFKMTIDDMNKNKTNNKQEYKVRVLPPPKYLTIKSIKHTYTVLEKDYSKPVDFKLNELDYKKYASTAYKLTSLIWGMSPKTENIDDLKDRVQYSQLTLTGEIAKYLNEKCSLISRILKESEDGIDCILEKVNTYNEIIYDVLIPKIFSTLNEIKANVFSQDKAILLLREPKDAGYYVFHAEPELVIRNTDANVAGFINRSFHADTYCFDSKPEKECFLQYLTNVEKVDEIYFTGMFTGNQGDFSISYYDPDSKKIRNYYPDFLAKMTDGTYQVIEVKGDNKIDDVVVKAKSDAAREIATESAMEYKIYASNMVIHNNVLELKYKNLNEQSSFEFHVAEKTEKYE